MSSTSRRSFLKTSAAAATVVSLATRRLAAAPHGVPIGLQLYSVRDLLPKDFDGTLSKLAAAGYSRWRLPATMAAPPPSSATPWTRPACAASALTTPLAQLRPHLDE